MTATLKTDRPAEPPEEVTEDLESHDAEFEGEIREFVRRDVAPWRKRNGEPPTEAPAESVNFLVQRVAGASINEIDHVLAELTNVREFLRSEGERIQREISGYANLSQTAMASMKIIAESMAQWRSAMGKSATPYFRE